MLDTIKKLHSAKVHFVLTKDKIAFQPGWQLHPPSLEAVQGHAKAGGQLGFIPGRSSLWVLDIDTFPGDDKDTDGLLANVDPLTIVNTRRGRHVYLKKPSRKIITNRKWSTSGFSGEFRGDNGYVVCWEIDKLADALDKLPHAATTSPTLFPRPPKQHSSEENSSPAQKKPNETEAPDPLSEENSSPTPVSGPAAVQGFVKGHRTDTLNTRVFTDELRGQTDHSEVTAQALAAGLPADKVAKANKKTIADAQAAKERTFPRKDADALEAALEALGITVRYNLRAMSAEKSNGGGKWTKTTDRNSADLRRQIADRFSYQLAGKTGTAPLRYGLDSWSEHLNALLFHAECDPFLVWLESLPKWDGSKRLAKLLTSCLGAAEGPLTSWASCYLTVGPIQRAYQPGCLLREIPILIGKQRIGKSQLLSNLLPPEYPDWFSDSVCVSDPSQKRIESLLGRVVCEMSELTGFRKAELESLKAFISRRDDGSTRLAYRHDPEPALRRFILVGSTNDPEPLPNDPSGNSRFVPVVCSRGTNIETFMAQWRTQLWAEGLARYREGERANLPRDQHGLQALHGERHRRKDSLLEDSVAGIDGDGPYTMKELFGMAYTTTTPNDRRAETRLGDALRLAGWVKKQERTEGGKRPHLWRRAD